MRAFMKVLSCSVLLLVSLCNQGFSQSSSPSTEQSAALSKQLQNPVAALISVPIESNFDFGVGDANKGFRYTAKLKPVIPYTFHNGWNLVSRTILPIVTQTDVFAPLSDSTDIGGESGVYPGQGSQAGLGDTTQSFFLSPRKPLFGKFLLGFGPVLVIPTGTSHFLSAGKVGAGPTVVVLTQKGKWTAGALFNYVHSFAGSGSRASLNFLYLQPFVSRSFGKGASVVTYMEPSDDFTNGSWTLPVTANVSQILKLGSQPFSVGVGTTYYATGPTGAPQWGMKLSVTLLFPKRPKH